MKCTSWSRICYYLVKLELLALIEQEKLIDEKMN